MIFAVESAAPRFFFDAFAESGLFLKALLFCGRSGVAQVAKVRHVRRLVDS